MKGYEKAVKAWLKDRASPDAWPILLDHWQTMVSKAAVYFERRGHRRPFQRNIMQGSQTMLAIAKEGKEREAIIRLLAMGYLYQADPRRFKSDRAFQFQVSRQFRSLTDVNVGITWDQKNEKTKRVYRDVSPRTLRSLWQLLCEARIPLYGMEIGKVDLEERTRRYYKPHEAIRAILGPTAAKNAENIPTAKITIGAQQ